MNNPRPSEPDAEHPDEHQKFPSETLRIELDALWAMLGRSPELGPPQTNPDDSETDTD